MARQTQRKPRSAAPAPADPIDALIAREDAALAECLASLEFARLRWRCLQAGPELGAPLLPRLRGLALDILGGDEDMADAVRRLTELELRQGQIPY